MNSKTDNRTTKSGVSAVALIIATGLVLSFATGASARAAGATLPVFKVKESRTFEASAPTSPGKTLSIEGREAYLTIAAGNDNAVTVDGIVEVSDDDREVVKYFLENTKLALEAEGDGLRLRLVSPMDEFAALRGRPPKTGIFRRFYRGDKFIFKVSYAARLNVRVPARYSLDVNNAYGDILVKGVNGRLKVDNRSGKVGIEGCGGELIVENSYDTVDVPGFAGGVEIKNSSGKVFIKDIQGAARVENSYDPVSFGRIAGTLIVNSKSAAVTGEGVDGDCEIMSSYGKIEVKGVKGKLTIKGPSCEVKAEDVAQETHIENSYNAVRAVRIGAGLRILSQSGKVTADDIGGDAFIRSSYDKITATRIKGSLEIEASSAGISIRTVTGETKVKTSYDAVVVEDVGGGLVVESQSGAVRAVGIKRNATITTSYNMVEVRGVGGTLTVEDGSGAVSAEDIGGDVKVKNSYNSVVLKKTSGSIEVHGSSSAIDVDEIRSLPKGARIELITTYNPVRLTLPDGADVVVAIKSEGGTVSSDFPVYHTGVQADLFREAVAKGGIPVRVETSGDIIIRGRAMAIRKN